MQRLCFGFLTFCLCIAFAAPSRAEQQVSTPEEIGIAFFKTGGSNPDFTKLAKGTRAYRLAPLVRRDAYLQQEKQRLIQLYNAYDPSHTLRVRTRTGVTLTETPRKDNTPLYSMTLSFGRDDTPFFPYKYQDYDIAVIPQKLTDLLHQNLSELQFNALKAAFDQQMQGTVDLYVELKPVKAYLDRPYDIEGTQQWVLLTNVAGMTLTTRLGARLWDYSAPWYVSPTTDGLRDMYDKKTEERQQEQQLDNPLRPAK